jgi:CubicO group peptidase (beta-lactamase class C family)
MVNDWRPLESFIQNKMEEEHIAGVAVGVTKAGKTIFQKGFGYRDIDQRLPVTPETIFGIASVTKSFTALAIIELERQGLLSVDDPVVQYLPDFKINGIEDLQTIKISHLLSHSTGLPPMERKESLNRFSQHIDYLAEAEYELLGEPGEYFSYCNDTFLLLGAIIENLTGRLYRRYMTSELLETFRMHRSTFSLEELMKFENVSVPYHFNLQSNRLVEVPWPTLGNFEVGGGIRSNVVDLLKYGQIYLKAGNHQKMRKPVIRVGRNTFYGYALQVTQQYDGKYTLAQHGGGQPGVSSNFGFVPEEDIVVTVLTNVGGVSAGEIWLAAVNSALGLPLEQKPSYEPVYELEDHEYKRFEGVYSSREGGSISVSFSNGTLLAKMDEQSFELRVSGHDTLVLLKNEKPLKFYFQDQDEKPWALFNGSRMLRRVLIETNGE